MFSLTHNRRGATIFLNDLMELVVPYVDSHDKSPLPERKTSGYTPVRKSPSHGLRIVLQSGLERTNKHHEAGPQDSGWSLKICVSYDIQVRSSISFKCTQKKWSSNEIRDT